MNQRAQPKIFVKDMMASQSSRDQGWATPADFDLDQDVAEQLRGLFPRGQKYLMYDAFLRLSPDDTAMRLAGWGLRADGAVLCLDPYRPEGVTVNDIVRATAEGLNEGDVSSVYLEVGAGGRGNGYLSWNDILTFSADESARLLFDAACYAIIRYAARGARRVKYRREQAVAQVWVKQQGIFGPSALRSFIDRKQCWDPATVAARLRVPKKFAKRLLHDLGYERDYRGAPWCRADRPEALRRRADWLEMENTWPHHEK